MTELADFFTPISIPKQRKITGTLMEYVDGHFLTFPNWREADIVIMGIFDEEQQFSVEAIRSQLYALSSPVANIALADLGNLVAQNNREALYEMVSFVVSSLIAEDKTVIILSPNQDITYGQYLAYSELGNGIQYVHVDAELDMDEQEGTTLSKRFNHKIFQHKPSFLYSYTNLGYQRYLVSEEELSYLTASYQQAIRYGELTQQIEEAEPYIRTADMLSFDFSAIRAAEAPGAIQPSPGGFSAMEACRIARYAGLAYHLSSISITSYVPQFDYRNQGALLSAMLVWYFMEGYYNRYDDYPDEERSQLRRYAVKLHATVETIHFFEHLRTGRWWMEVPYQISGKAPSGPGILIPCSKKDYEFAKGDDIPDKWWVTYSKISK